MSLFDLIQKQDLNLKMIKIIIYIKQKGKMNWIKYWLAILITAYILQIVGAKFCFPLCEDTKACDDITYDKCKGNNCRANSGFQNAGNEPFFCKKKNYNYYSNDVKWEPSGFSPDIPLGTYGVQYQPNSNITSKTLTIIPATLGQCDDGGTTYRFYDLIGTNTLTIIHPALTTDMNFYQVRLIYQVITFEQWPTSRQINTLFISNSTGGPRSRSISAADQQQLCMSGAKERYLAIINDYTYGDKTTGFQWQISSTGTSTMRWGVLNIIVSIRLCHPFCQVCTGDRNTQCTVCAWTIEQTKLSFQTCDKNCLVGYGDDSLNPSVCIDCTDPNCRYCFDLATDCRSCNNSYFLLQSTPGIVTCVLGCPAHYYGVTTGNDTCVQCDPNCFNCTGNPTTCLNCYSLWFLYQSTCVQICPNQTFANSTSGKCQACNNYCYICEFSPTNCTVCDTTGQYVSYLKSGTTCVVQCGQGYFSNDNNGMGPNLCLPCDPKCKACDISLTNCSVCNPGYYLLNFACNVNCPYPEYFNDNNTWRCLDCATYCVNMTLSLRWKNSLKDQIICDMQFTQQLSWGPTEIANWIKVTTNDTTIDLNNFNFVYEVVSPKIMRLRLSPKGFTFIYNVTFKFKTITFNAANQHYAANGYRFRETNHDVKDQLVWFLIKAPSLTQTETQIMDSFANISQKIIEFTTLPYVQEIKKTGVFAFVMAGAQATSSAILVNTIPSQNFYQGVRLWASFIFFDVPPWEQSSQKSKYMVVPNIDNLIQNARLLPEEIKYQEHRIRFLFDTESISWRFQRTGYTSFFVFDTYMNIVMIVVCWILLGVAHYLIKHKVHQSKLLTMFYSFTLRVHEVTIFYISLTTMLEWIYFEPTSVQRYISLGLCLLFNVYFLAYELYIYYDMINYPVAQIGNKNYDYYVIRYGSLLKHMRFQEYDPYEQWSMKHWFRPYNYHIMSYYKKFLMMIALPIFYSTKYAQVGSLIAIQLMEIVRFLVIWPFHQKARNYIRLGLQLCLLLFFVSILIQSLRLPDIMSGDQAIIASAVNIYYLIGWIGFVMCFIFNIGHIVIWIYDCVLGCRKSNRDLMDEARKGFYMEKLKEFEDEHSDVPLGLVNKWVKLGNLNDRKYDVLPDINLRVEYFKIVKNHMGFEIDMKKLFEVFMNIDFNYQKENNIAAGKKMNKRFTLTRNLSPTFYLMIENIYNQYAATMDFQHLTLKTFQKVLQSELEAGQKIIFDPLKMQQNIEMETAAGQKKTIKLKNLLPGFPLSYEDLKQFT